MHYGMKNFDRPLPTITTTATSTAIATSLSTHIKWETVCLQNKIYISHVETHIIVSFYANAHHSVLTIRMPVALEMDK